MNDLLLAPHVIFDFLMGLLLLRVFLDGRFRYLPIFVLGGLYNALISSTQFVTTNELSVIYFTVIGLGLGTDIFMRLQKHYSAKLMITKK